MKISCIGIFEYFALGGGLRTALSDYYVKNNDCVILSAADGTGGQIGLMIFEEKAVVEVLYLKADGNSVKAEMLNYLIAATDKNIRYRTVNSEDDEKIAFSCGFRHESDLNIYRSKDRDHPDVISFFEKYGKLYDSAAKRGYGIKSFEELNGDELDQIVCDPDGEFVSGFDPGKFLNGNFGDLSKKISTAVTKNGKVIAYSLLRCVGGKCIFEILCVARSYRKTFAVIPAIIRSINEMLKAGFARITFAVYQTNAEMIRITETDMIKVLEPAVVQHNMIHIKNKSNSERKKTS